jgi:hypothetical protein
MYIKKYKSIMSISKNIFIIYSLKSEVSFENSF